MQCLVEFCFFVVVVHKWEPTPHEIKAATQSHTSVNQRNRDAEEKNAEWNNFVACIHNEGLKKNCIRHSYTSLLASLNRFNAMSFSIFAIAIVIVKIVMLNPVPVFHVHICIAFYTNRQTGKFRLNHCIAHDNQSH